MNMADFSSRKQPVPVHEWPDPFRKADGSRVRTPEEWSAQREYLKDMLRHCMYGHMPPAPANTKGELLYSRSIYQGRAVAETIRITFGPDDLSEHQVAMIVHMTRPSGEGKVPVITWNQFKGSYGCPEEEYLVCEQGYAIVEFDKEQLAPDSAKAADGPLAHAYPDYDWGAIAMWSWGHSRVIDYLATTSYADMDKIVATGHSRGGKVAICAAIYDERIALCGANGSGCGGAGCFRYLGGRLGEGTGRCETVSHITKSFPYWWNKKFCEYGKKENADCIPFDLHFLKALIAPRALITTDGLGDTWANPYGTQITWMAADEVYHFLGAGGRNALHIREGGHEYMGSDWLVLADFCDMIFFGKEKKSNLVTSSRKEMEG